MHLLVRALFGFVAFFWIFHGLRVAYGLLHLPWIKDFARAGNADCPRISLLFAARDEEEKLPAALATLAGIDYPNLEIVAVDDRSRDATGHILDDFDLCFFGRSYGQNGGAHSVFPPARSSFFLAGHKTT